MRLQTGLFAQAYLTATGKATLSEENYYRIAIDDGICKIELMIHTCDSEALNCCPI
jgi:hypothetical protein